MRLSSRRSFSDGRTDRHNILALLAPKGTDRDLRGTAYEGDHCCNLVKSRRCLGCQSNLVLEVISARISITGSSRPINKPS